MLNYIKSFFTGEDARRKCEGLSIGEIRQLTGVAPDSDRPPIDYECMFCGGQHYEPNCPVENDKSSRL